MIIDSTFSSDEGLVASVSSMGEGAGETVRIARKHQHDGCGNHIRTRCQQCDFGRRLGSVNAEVLRSAGFRATKKQGLCEPKVMAHMWI